MDNLPNPTQGDKAPSRVHRTATADAPYCLTVFRVNTDVGPWDQPRHLAVFLEVEHVPDGPPCFWVRLEERGENAFEPIILKDADVIHALSAGLPKLVALAVQRRAFPGYPWGTEWADEARPPAGRLHGPLAIEHAATHRRPLNSYACGDLPALSRLCDEEVARFMSIDPMLVWVDPQPEDAADATP